MLTSTFTTAGGATFTISESQVGGLQISAESPSYGPHAAFVVINSDGGNPTVTVQKGSGSHVMVVPAGAGDVLYDSEA